MTVTVEDLERLGAGPLLETLVSLFDDGQYLHGAATCSRMTGVPSRVELSLREVHGRWNASCSCLRMLQGTPLPLRELMEVRAIALSMEGLAPLPLEGTSPKATVSVARRLTSLEEALDQLSVLAPAGASPAALLSEHLAGLESELAHLREVYEAGRQAALRLLAASQVATDLLPDSDRQDDPVRSALRRVAPVWRELVADGLDAPARLSLLEERFVPDHSAGMLHHVVALLEERLEDYQAAPDLLAIVVLPPRPPDGLYRLVADAFSKAEESSRLRLMVLPAFALEFLKGVRGFELSSVTRSPEDPVVLENAIAMWAPGSGPLGVADSLVSAATAVQR